MGPIYVEYVSQINDSVSAVMLLTPSVLEVGQSGPSPPPRYRLTHCYLTHTQTVVLSAVFVSKLSKTTAALYRLHSCTYTASWLVLTTGPRASRAQTALLGACPSGPVLCCVHGMCEKNVYGLMYFLLLASVLSVQALSSVKSFTH